MKLKKFLSFLSVVVLMLVLVPSAQAANVTGLKDTLSSSVPSADSDHTIDFTAATDVPGDGTIEVTFPAGFDLTSLVVADIDLTLNGLPATLVAGAPGAGEVGYAVALQVMTFTFDTAVTLDAGQTVKIEIGTVAGGTNQVTNSTAGIHTMTLETTDGTDPIDTGDLKLSINNAINVSATIQSSLTFTIAGVTTGSDCLNADAPADDAADVTSTADSIPFGTVSAGAGGRKIACQTLTVSTNATGGYVVTVEQDDDLTAGNGTDIIGKFEDGTYGTPAVWDTPDGAPHSHFGFTTNDTTAAPDGYDGFASYKYAQFAADVTPYGIMRATGPVSADAATASYSIEIDSLQEAGVYTNTLMYICTATF